MNDIENAFGRVRHEDRPKGPRTLDIDILLYGASILSGNKLIIPHPELKNRLFALLPLLDLDESLVDPISGIPLKKIAQSLPPQGIYLLE